MFISNNRVLFHLLWKENLGKNCKVSKYYENYCSFKIKNIEEETSQARKIKTAHSEKISYILANKSF